MNNFPTNVAIGSTHSIAGRTWQWNGISWRRHDLVGSIVSSTPPSNPVPGMRWINSILWRSFDYSGKEWIEVSSQGSGGRQIELGSTSTHVQWRYIGDETWTNLFNISNIVSTSVIDGGSPFSVPETILDGGAP